MKVILWVSGKLNSQSLILWAKEKKHDIACLATMDPGSEKLAWATGNLADAKQASDTNKIDLIYKSVKKSGQENFDALDAILKFSKDKYGADAVIVTKDPDVAQPIRNSAKKFNLKTLLLPK